MTWQDKWITHAPRFYCCCCGLSTEWCTVVPRALLDIFSVCGGKPRLRMLPSSAKFIITIRANIHHTTPCVCVTESVWVCDHTNKFLLVLFLSVESRSFLTSTYSFAVCLLLGFFFFRYNPVRSLAYDTRTQMKQTFLLKFNCWFSSTSNRKDWGRKDD